MNNHIKELHLKAIHKLCYQATKHIILNNNKIPELKLGYEIKDNTTNETKTYQIILQIKETKTDKPIHNTIIIT